MTRTDVYIASNFETIKGAEWCILSLGRYRNLTQPNGSLAISHPLNYDHQHSVNDTNSPWLGRLFARLRVNNRE